MISEKNINEGFISRKFNDWNNNRLRRKYKISGHGYNSSYGNNKSGNGPSDHLELLNKQQ